jgi:hypothetical protein
MHFNGLLGPCTLCNNCADASVASLVINYVFEIARLPPAHVTTLHE